MAKPISLGKTYTDTFTGQSGPYNVIAYIKNSDGTRTYFPTDCEPETTQKISSLVKALLDAHSAKQQQENAPAYGIKKMNASGLVKTDNSIISHDFRIQPISPQLAAEMQTTLDSGTEASSVKALDIWNAFETTVRNAIQRQDTSRPVQMRPEPIAEKPTAELPTPTPPPEAPIPKEKTYKATALDIPHVSYTDIVFKDLFKKGEEVASWKHLPPVIKLDVLRHTSWGCTGRAETFARNHFGRDFMRINEKIDKLEKSLPALRTVDGLSDAFVDKAQTFLSFYYSKDPKRYGHFSEEIKKVPLEPLFLHYVWEMAKAAGVEIEEWDVDFAKNNYYLTGMIALSVQALERCLHVPK